MFLNLHIVDWLVIATLIGSTVGVGLYFTRRARQSKDDYLLAGRNLGWFVAGTSIVATTFSSDTPLFVSRITREVGIFENWWWWSGAIGQLAAVFFFARLWRRSGITTDVEFVASRYESGFAATAIRLVRAVFDGVFVNCMIVASVTLGMVKIITTILGLDNLAPIGTVAGMEITWPMVVVLMLSLFTLVYTTMAGLYGVVYADVIQFLLAMAGSIYLGIVVYLDLSKNPGMMTQLAAAPGFKAELMRFFPSFEKFDMKAFAFFVYIGMIWWFSAPSGGFYVQRMLATKNEDHAAKAFLWYNFCQYVLRPWPWILVGLASLIYFPQLTGPDAEKAYPAMVGLFMGVGLKGLMVAALMAAYMSTVATHLHLGVSYLVNDVYQPYLAPNRTQKHYVTASQITMIGLTAVAAIMCLNLESITGVYRFLGVYWAGMGTILIARWYWWRINAVAELSALLTAIAFTLLLEVEKVQTLLTRVCEKIGLVAAGEKPELMTVNVTITLFVVTLTWVLVALFTQKGDPSAKTIEFYKKLRVSGAGWTRVAALAGIEPIRGEFAANFGRWILSLVWLFSLLIGVGKLLFLEWELGISLLVVGIVSGEILRRQVMRGGLT